MLATFNGTWNWTGIGTLVLAAVTFLAVLVAAIALRQTRADIALSRKEVEEAHRPVLAPIVDTTAQMDLGADGKTEKLPVLAHGRLYVPVRNIGAGPALEIEALIEMLDDAKPAAEVSSGLKAAKVAGLGVTRSLPMLVETPGWTKIPSFVLSVVYRDVAKKGWRTKCIFDHHTGRYEEITIDEYERPRP